MKGPKLSAETEVEIVGIYENSDTMVSEIEETYGISTSRFYNLLKRHGIVTRRALIDQGEQNGRVIEPTRELAVTVDSQSTVVESRPTRVVGTEGKWKWEITFFGQVEVRGDTPEDALREARKLGIVRDVRHVKRLAS